MGIVGHSQSISNMTLTLDGTRILTAGGEDGVVCLWKFNAAVLDAQIEAAGLEMKPFLYLLDPERGKDGDIYREFWDYFYYGQIKSYAKA